MSKKVLRVDYRDRARHSLRITAASYRRDPAEAGWYQFLSTDETVLSTRVLAADVLAIVDEDDIAPARIGFA